MIHEHEVIGTVARLNLGMNNDRVAKPALEFCISVFNINGNIVQDEAFTCALPFDSISVTVNGKKHKDWLEQLIKTEWIWGFPDGFKNKVVRVKYHYDDKTVRTNEIKNFTPVDQSTAEEERPDTITYQSAETIVSEIDFIDYPKGLTVHSDSKTCNSSMYRVDIFEYSQPYTVELERLEHVWKMYDNLFICGVGEIIPATKNELVQILGEPVDYPVDKSVWNWDIKMNIIVEGENELGQPEVASEAYILQVYDYTDGQGIEPDEMYRYHIGGIPMVEGDTDYPMLTGNEIYSQMPLKLFKAFIAKKLLELRGNDIQG